MGTEKKDRDIGISQKEKKLEIKNLNIDNYEKSRILSRDVAKKSRDAQV